MVWLDRRHLQAEEMDQPTLPLAQHRAALRGLARINWWSRSDAILWPSLAQLATTSSRPLRILDVATGAGDVPIRLWNRAKRAGLTLQIEACDLSPVALEHARDNAAWSKADIRFFVHDALHGPPLEGYDAVLSSLFLHHLSESDAVQFLRRMADASTQLVLVNDLLRSTTGFVLAHLATRLLTFSHVVHVDGPRSVTNAFTMQEAGQLAEQAGLNGATFSRHWPCRFLMRWSRQ